MVVEQREEGLQAGWSRRAVSRSSEPLRVLFQTLGRSDTSSWVGGFDFESFLLSISARPQQLLPGNFWILFSSCRHLPRLLRRKDKAARLPRPSSSFFPPVSPDLSASVFSPSLCLTGRLSPSRHSLRRLSAAFISAGQGHPRNAAVTPQMKRSPCLLEGGKKERKILIVALRCDLE